MDSISERFRLIPSGPVLNVLREQPAPAILNPIENATGKKLQPYSANAESNSGPELRRFFMNLRIKALTGILAIACAWTPFSNGQQRPVKTSTLRVVQMNGIDMAAFLATLAVDYEITIGLEVDPDQPKPQIELNLRDVNFSQILDGLVKAEPKYRWREQDGSIEVLPISGGSILLDTPIQSFQVKDVNRAVAVNRLLGLREVQAMASSMNLKPRPPNDPSERIKDEKLSFDLSGVTMRQALNRIASDSGGRFWVFRRYPDGTLEISLR